MRGFIFTKIMSFQIEEAKVDLPKDAYTTYINNQMKKSHIKALAEWQRGIDVEFEILQEIVECAYTLPENPPGSNSSNEGVEGGISLYGLEYDGELKTFVLDDSQMEDTKQSTYEEVLLNILYPYYSDVNNELFGNSNLYLGAFRSFGNDIEQSTKNALRSAYVFSIMNYHSNETLYSDFYEAFTFEYYKRAELVKSILDSTPNEEIVYIPIFDNVSNHKYKDNQKAHKLMKNLLVNDVISISKKDELQNLLIEQVKETLIYSDSTYSEIREDILKPIISKTVNLHKAKTFLTTAIRNIESNKYDSAINRCYYSMMRGLRALMAEYGLLSDWRGNSLSPNETHIKLEIKFKDEIIPMLEFMNSNDLRDFIYVKDQRLLADYAEMYLSDNVAKNCIRIATDFLEKIEKHVRLKH